MSEHESYPAADQRGAYSSRPAPTDVRTAVGAGQLRVSDELGTDIYLRIDPDGTLVLPRWLLRELARLIIVQVGSDELHARQPSESGT